MLGWTMRWRMEISMLDSTYGFQIIYILATLSPNT